MARERTKAVRAAELLKMLKRGPAFSTVYPGGLFTKEEATKCFQVWSSSWIIPEVCSLIPELRAPKEKKRRDP